MLTPQKEQQLRDDFANNQTVIHTKRGSTVRLEPFADYWIARMKEQEEELVKKIEEYRSELPNDFWNEIEQGRYQAIEYILNIINPKHE